MGQVTSFESTVTVIKKLSYCRESPHLTSLYRTVQRHFNMWNCIDVYHECDRQTDGRTDGQVAVSNSML